MVIGKVLIGCKLNFSTFGPLIRKSILRVSTFISLGFGPVRVSLGLSQTISSLVPSDGSPTCGLSCGISDEVLQVLRSS